MIATSCYKTWLDPVKLTEIFQGLGQGANNPELSEIVQQFCFHTRAGAAYVAELRVIAEFCNFGAVST